MRIEASSSDGNAAEEIIPFGGRFGTPAD